MNVNLLGKLKVGSKFGVIVAVFTIALVAITYFFIEAEMAVVEEAQTLDIVGRQRVLNQLYVRDILLHKNGMSNDYAYWHKVQVDTLPILINGGMVVKTLHQNERIHVQPAPNQEIINALKLQQSHSKTIEDLAGKVLKLSVKDPKYDAAVEALAKEADVLHFIINDSVKAYDEHFRNSAQNTITYALILGILSLLIGLGLSYFVVRSITRPLGELANMAGRVSKGNLTGAAVSVSSKDEIGLLTEAMNGMQSNLKEQIGQINEATGNLNSTSQQILAAAKQQAATVNEQVASIQETTSTMAEIKKAGDQITEKSKEVGAAGESTLKAGQDGLVVVEKANSTMDNIQEQVELVAENIVQLSEKTQAVGEIVAGVNDISEQSHLLSLNASIEASSAGEAGKRFSVVASEMKNLADQAKEATVKVRSLLEEIQKGITSSVMLTEEAVKKVTVGKDQSGQAADIIREFSESSKESVQTFQQIAAATGQQQIGIDQSNGALADIQKASEQTASGTQQLESAVANINALIQQLQKSIEQYQV